MNRITEQAYRAECRDIAIEALTHTEGDRDYALDLLHETIDDHQWIIYTGYHAQILDHTTNENAYFDEFGELTAESYSDATTKMAFAAFKQDCLEALDRVIAEREEQES